MPKRTISQQIEQLDPMFYIPEGATEFDYIDRLPATDEEVADFAASDESEIDFSEFDDAIDTDVPFTPQITSIVSQTVHKTAAGNEVVDVVIEVDDIDGVTSYEFRVTKV